MSHFSESSLPHCSSGGVERTRLFAVVPAAGQSRRMGQAKLLLRWGTTTVMERVVSVLQEARCTEIVVVVRSDDAELAELVLRCGARVVQPSSPPAEMRISVQWALAEIETRWHPSCNDAWLLAPADHPTLDVRWIEALLEARRTHPDAILVPVHGGRRGHPVLFPWSLAAEIPGLPTNRGINHLLQGYADRVCEVEVVSPGVLDDLDTPDDYQRLLRPRSSQEGSR